ncbi:MAG TPA: SDR family oxidoreductase, partial [Noviherbaspirillum sp.]|nr:SDR family oxidoreductase [Noviherbaspirillum sp.]
VADLTADKLRETVRLCNESGSDTRGYALNVTDEAAVEDAFCRVAQDFGALDGLINNAGVNADALLVKRDGGEIGKMSLADFNKVLQVNLVGVFLCGREAAVHMLALGRGGVLINISSIAQVGNIGQSNYAAAKAGVSAMTVTWAQELAQYGIRVAGIAPGFTSTPMVARMKPAMQDRFRQRIPLRRFAEPVEIAHAAAFILENDYFSGRILEIDGGLRL